MRWCVFWKDWMSSNIGKWKCESLTGKLRTKDRRIFFVNLYIECAIGKNEPDLMPGPFFVAVNCLQDKKSILSV